VIFRAGRGGRGPRIPASKARSFEQLLPILDAGIIVLRPARRGEDGAYLLPYPLDSMPLTAKKPSGMVGVGQSTRGTCFTLMPSPRASCLLKWRRPRPDIHHCELR